MNIEYNDLRGNKNNDKFDFLEGVSGCVPLPSEFIPEEFFEMAMRKSISQNISNFFEERSNK